MPPTATTSPRPEGLAEQAVRLIAIEREAVLQQDIDELRAIWLADGVAVDANHTPHDPSDDRRWEGWPALAERYAKEVFPFAALPTEAPRTIRLTPTVTVLGATEVEVTLPAADGRTPKDRWLLIAQEGALFIKRLTFNLEPAQ
jgi:hypothetical protein